MALFKSKAEKRIERTIQVNKTLGAINNQIKKLQKQEGSYINSARDAQRVGAPQQEMLAKKALKATMTQRRRLEQQLLTLKIASQMKDQAETHAQFAKALTAVSKTIGEMFGQADMAKTMKDFEMGMAKAQNLEERMDLFLSSSSESMLGADATSDEVVTDSELDRLIAGEAAAAESGSGDASMDQQIADGLKQVERELEGGR